MITVSCTACGWSQTEPSKLQADVVLVKHRRELCPNYRLCMLCGEIGEGKVRPLDAKPRRGEPSEEGFICNDCNDVHPRDGDYAFDGLGAPSRNAMGSRKGKIR